MSNWTALPIQKFFGIAYNGHTYMYITVTLTEFVLQRELLKDVHDVVLVHLIVYHGYLVFLYSLRGVCS